jgi:hypothetical protein
LQSMCRTYGARVFFCAYPALTVLVDFWNSAKDREHTKSSCATAPRGPCATVVP